MDTIEKTRKSQVNGGKILRIDEIENFLLGNYEIRINVITNTIEKRPKGTNDAFYPVNENDLKYQLLKSGYSRFDGELKALWVLQSFQSLTLSKNTLRVYPNGINHNPTI
ncbi:MAG: hypothetical protein R2822_22595 [Spirosomataceae bacterium]